MSAPFSGLAPARRRQALVLVVVLVSVASLAVWALARGSRAQPAADQATPGPVVVVAGYGGNTRELEPLVTALRRSGRVVTVLAPSGDNTGDLRAQARRLAGEVRRVRGAATSVDLVGFSAGGVVVRLYVREDGGVGVVRRVLTLGSPQHGTDVAALAQQVAGSCPTACEQLATGSTLLRQLNAGDETPSGPQWVTVRTDDDAVVTPAVSATLAGALNLRVQQFCPAARTAHGDLPADPVVLAALPYVLGSGPVRPPSRVTC